MIVLGLGTNMGDRLQNLQRALKLLESRSAVRIDFVSNIYETVPFGVTEQPDFLNMVVVAETDLAPVELLMECLAVEDLLGRVRTLRWGPRTIDIDLLIYDDLQLQLPELTLPHPGIAGRGFVLRPFGDVLPDFRLGNGRSVAEMAEECLSDKPDEVKLWREVRWDSVRKNFV